MPPANARPARIVDGLRTLLALAAILPGLFAGLAVQLFTGDRRRAVNRALSMWGSHGLRAAGIRLVVENAEALRAPRPAVYLLNHASGIDPILVCALLERDLFAVAKQEIRRNPLFGPAFAFAGVVFIDRADRAQAIRALTPAVDAIRSGLSLVVAPEGTRGRKHGEVGPFKKGAFHIAMAAGVPVIPLVIHDAAAVLPRRGWVMRAGTVHVTVLPPIPTTDWKPERLDVEIERIRESYRETLTR